jgi:hypothetical protein
MDFKAKANREKTSVREGECVGCTWREEGVDTLIGVANVENFELLIFSSCSEILATS